VSHSRPLYTKKHASWYITARDKSSRLSAERRIREGLKLARKFYSGFDSKDGFDSRRLRHWPDARLERLNRFIAEARRLTSGENHALYTLHRPRNSEQRSALILHSGLISPNERTHPMRAWPIYTNTRKVKIRYVKERVLVGAAMGRPIYEERTRAEVRRPVGVRGGVLVHRDYLFREVLGFQPGIESTTPEGIRVGKLLRTLDPWEQILKAMEMLLPRLPDRTLVGNEAYYRLLSDRGPVGTSVPKHMLIDRMQVWGEDYEMSSGFVGTLIGVRYVGDEFKAVRGPQSVDARAEKRRARYQEMSRERVNARARITRHGHVSKPGSKPKPKPRSKPKLKPKTPPRRKPGPPRRHK
jgi:hypothetical protein